MGIVVGLVAAGCGQRVRSGEVLDTAPIHTFNELEADVYLQRLSQREQSLTQRVAIIARQSVGQPYRLGLLGEGPFDSHDPDPLYCLSASDCVTFVEQTYAMALSRDWPSFFKTLKRLRYRYGEIGLLTRNHFTEADWNVHNDWLFDDVTDTLVRGAAIPMRVNIDRKAFFGQFGVETDFEVEPFDTTYIPRDRIADVMPSLADGDVIEFVRGESDRPYVGHLGLAFRDDNTAGEGPILIHSGKPAVQELPLREYLIKHQAVIGIKVLRPRSGK